MSVASVTAIAACSQHASPSQSARPSSALRRAAAGSQDLRLAHLVEYEDSSRVFTQTSPADTTTRLLGTQWFAERMTRERERPGILLVKRSGNGTVIFTDTLMMLRDGLRPLWEHVRFGGGLKDIRFDGVHVHQVTYAHDSVIKTLDKDFSSAPFGFNQLEMAMRSLPLRVGFTTTLPLYSEGDDSVEVDTVTVVGVIAGPPATWMIRFADPAIVSTYTIDTAQRRVIGSEVTNRKSGGRFWSKR
jgi:hypothetical protein